MIFIDNSNSLTHYGVKGMKWGHHKYKTTVSSGYNGSNFNKNSSNERSRFMVNRAAATANLANSGKDPREARRTEFRYQLRRNVKRSRARLAASNARKKYSRTSVSSISKQKTGAGYDILNSTGLWRTNKNWRNPNSKRISRNRRKQTGIKQF